jgi:predicted secreted protein
MIKWLLHSLTGIAVIAALAAFPADVPAAEQTQPRYNVVEFQAEGQREVRNDLLNATLYVELNDTNPAALADAINTRVNDALRVAKEYKDVRVRSGDNRTFPVYSKTNVLQGWRGRAEIRIESRDFGAASALIGKLQASMQLGGISFSVAPETRRAVEDQLTVEALGAFKARAEVLKGALSGRGYKLVRVSVTGGYQPPQPRLAMARAQASEVTAPDLEGGVSQIRIVANGAIEITE